MTAMCSIIPLEIQPQMLEMLGVLHRQCFGAAAWSTTQISGSLSQPTCQGWAVMNEGSLVGFILVQRSGDDAEILTLAVHPDYRRQGLAKKLATQAIKSTREYGAKRILLEVGISNIPAQALYTHLGFSTMATRRDYYRCVDGHYEDALVMSLQFQ